MLRLLTAFALLVSSGLALQAQNVGDSGHAVESALGLPQMSRATGQGEVWVYSNGVRITFRNGVVAVVEGLENGVPVAPSMSTSESVTVVPDSRPSRQSVSVERDPSRPGALTSLTGPDGEPSRVGWLVIVAVGLVSGTCQVLILIQAFRTSLLWGLGCIFVPLVSLFFVVCHWSEVKKPFLVNLGTIGAFLAFAFLT